MTNDRTIPGWPTFDPAVLEHENDRKCFLNRKSAVDLRLIDRKRPSEVLQITNIRPSDLKDLIARCLETHPDDQRAYGYRALVPHLKTRYERSSPESPGLPGGRGKSGMFAALMATHEANLKDYVTELFLRGKKLANGAYQPQSSEDIYELFLERCRLLLYPKDGSEPLLKPYPFSTSSNGERSFYRFLQELRGQHPLQVIAQEHGVDAATAFSTDSRGETIRRVPRLLRSVMLDGHHIAAEGVVKVPQPSGMPSLILLSDVMSVDWIDRDESIVFGHHLALTGSYNRYDVLRSIASGLGLIRPEEGIREFLPVHFLPQLEWVAFDQLELDRALAHLAEEVIEVLEGTVNARVLFDEAHKPRKRPHIESLYAELQSRGFRRLPSAHQPGRTRVSRAQAFERAKAHQIEWADLEETAKRCLRERLLGPRRKVEGRSQLDYLRWQLETNPGCLRHVPRELQFSASILRVKVEATLRGGAKLKKNPHFNVIWGEYRGKIISKSEAYLDHRFILIGHSEDVRYLDAYEGKRLVDRTKVGQPWALTPHSFETRSNAMRLFRELKIRPRRLVDGVATYKALLEDRARKTPTKQIAKELARLEREERSQNARVIVPSQADPNVETTPDVAIPELEVVVSEPEPQPVPPPWRRRRGVSFF